jgi:L-threonylcarbamoyladenylate synthase
LLPKHYAPKAKLQVLTWVSAADLRSQISHFNFEATRIHVVAHTHIPSEQGLGRVSVIPHDPEAFARALYAELHRCDEEGAQLIVVEAPPDEPVWRGIADRLARAAA